MGAEMRWALGVVCISLACGKVPGSLPQLDSGMTVEADAGSLDAGPPRADSGAPADAGSQGPVPAWLLGVAVDQWKELPNSSMSLAPVGMTVPGTNASGRMNAWNGYVAKGTDIFSVRQGGHTDYYGNEVLKFDLGSDAPHWAMIKNASTYSAGLIIDNTSRYADLAPASVHGYAHQRYIAQRDWVISVGSTAVPLNGGSPAECVAYDVANNAYLPAGSMPDAMPMSIADHAVWDDPVTGNVFHNYARTINRWNQATNTWSFNVASMADNYGIPGVACTDTTRRRALILGGDPLAKAPYLYDLASDTPSKVTVTGDLTPTNRSHFGMTYSPVTDRFYVMLGEAGGGGLYEIHPTTFNCSVKVTTGGAGMAPDWGNGVYTRFIYIASLGGIVYFPQYTSNAWFLRLH